MAGTVKLSNEMLKKKLTDAMVARQAFGSAKDLNDIRTPGCYLLNGPTGQTVFTNSPRSTQRGVLLVFSIESVLLQVVFSREPYKFIAYRLDWFGVAWTDWQIFSPSA